MAMYVMGIANVFIAFRNYLSVALAKVDRAAATGYYIYVTANGTLGLILNNTINIEFYRQTTRYSYLLAYIQFEMEE